MRQSYSSVTDILFKTVELLDITVTDNCNCLVQLLVTVVSVNFFVLAFDESSLVVIQTIVIIICDTYKLNAHSI